MVTHILGVESDLLNFILLKELSQIGLINIIKKSLLINFLTKFVITYLWPLIKKMLNQLWELYSIYHMPKFIGLAPYSLPKIYVHFKTSSCNKIQI